MADEEITDVPQPEPPKKGRFLLILVALLVLAALGGSVAWYLRKRSATQATEATQDQQVDAAPKATAVLHLEGFVVNLADPGQSAFLRVGIDIGLKQEVFTTKDAQKDSPLSPMVRDALLGVLTAQKSEQLLAPDGKTKLKELLLAALRQRVPELGATDVYFTDFLVQR